MNDEEETERQLQALFDGSAERLEGAHLTRLRARVAEIPERAERRPRWLPRWAWAPALGGIFAGLGALGATLLGAQGPLAIGSASSREVPSPSPSTLVAASASASSNAAPLLLEELEDWPSEEDDALSFDLAADVGDDELDAWLQALDGS
jgi:hypothetical protein